MQSTLRRRMIFYLALMVSGSLLIGVAAVVGVNGVHGDMNIALQGNQQLRQVYEVGIAIATAKHDLSASRPDHAAASTAMDMALATLDGNAYGGSQMPPNWLDQTLKAEFHSQVEQTVHLLKQPATEEPAVADVQLSSVNALLGQLAIISADVRSTIATRQQAAENKRHQTLLITISLAVLICFAAIAIGIVQYRSVMRPLLRLSRGVRHFSAGGLDERIETTGDREFASLASDFNAMAAELAGLYRELEQKVAAKSRELVRSERLASVGHLAAGVAHEMNNPLGIIAGYGERSLQNMARGLDNNTLPSAERAIRIMTEEAFRCKEITARLLTLARPGASNRGRISISAVIKEVISSLGGLPEYSDRRITLESPTDSELPAMANEGEIRQVMVNLLLNALQATPPAVGQVHVSVTQTGPDVEIFVRDNGCGMAPETLEHVFEPFFTEKRGRQQPGTGLGLSITHAIILDHGGQIRAESAGVGLGSRFIVRLPAAEEGANLASVA